ncbi:hypothetical protein HK101_010300 [Irineochytrium annulatum]|nr:hypothetical protein HK101_010300 [Irineochytrium annulatum]
MDDVTFECIKLSNQTIDLGFVKAKGRANGVHAYGINLDSDGPAREQLEEVTFGYERERAIISDKFESWCKSALDGTARGNLMKSTFTKIITAFLETTVAAFIFDDTQWLDSSTLDVLTQISRFCPKIYLQILSRPLKDSANKAISAVVTLPETEHLVLSGFTKDECLQMIEWKMKSLTLHISSVNPEILSAIFVKTGGNPLFLQLTIEVVVAKIGSDLRISPDGELIMAAKDASADMMLSDLGAAVLFQFDRLDPSFQRILKAASILGQYFVLTDVLDILKLDFSEDEAMSLMRKSDVYSFLLFPDHQQNDIEVATPPTSAVDEGDAGTHEEAREIGGVRLSFRHIGILNAIYDSLSFEERIGMNKFVAEVMEGLLDDDNQDSLLPSIEFHYTRAGLVDKIIQYRERLGGHSNS